MKGTTLLLSMAFAATLSAEGPILVYKVQSSQSHSFACGDRCKFRAPVEAGPVRLRIFRGRTRELTRNGHNARYIQRGCVQLRSTIIRAQRYKDLIDLKFYFTRQWLSGDTVDGTYTFLIERDDAPPGAPQVESNIIRLSTEDVDQYFGNGINVTVRAPMHRAAAPAPAARVARDRPPAMAAMMAGDAFGDDGARALEAGGFRDMPILPPDPCMDVSFLGGPAPVVVRRASLTPQD